MSDELRAVNDYSETMSAERRAAMDDPTTAGAESVPETLGARIRQHRHEAGLSVRGLAAKLGLSPSLISQIERGRSTPSVATLLAIASELKLPMATLFDGVDPAAGQDGAAADGAATPLQLHGDRQAITLATGVRWERLNPAESGVDFTYVVYPPGAASCEPDALRQHNGHEYGYVLSGRLGVQIGFKQYLVGPNDSIAFDSTRPHRLSNDGDEPVVAIWMVLEGS
jgi:transcriptional regulator with XRE-family HTH domain